MLIYKYDTLIQYTTFIYLQTFMKYIRLIYILHYFMVLIINLNYNYVITYYNNHKIIFKIFKNK